MAETKNAIAEDAAQAGLALPALNTFRIYFDSTHVDIEAETPNQARQLFKKADPAALIKKIKFIREGTAK